MAGERAGEPIGGGRGEREVRYRPMHEADVSALSVLIRRTFLQYIACTYRRRGVRRFLRHNSPRGLRSRLRAGQLLVVAEPAGRREGPVGVIALRGGSHVSLLFVDPTFHGRGIGRGLLRAAVETLGNGTSTITVNSSEFALGFYRRLGFEPTGAAFFRKGTKITPMRRSTRSSPGQSGP